MVKVIYNMNNIQSELAEMHVSILLMSFAQGIRIF